MSYNQILENASVLPDTNGSVKFNFEGQKVHEHLIDLGVTTQKLNNFVSKEDKLSAEIGDLKNKFKTALYLNTFLFFVILLYLLDKTKIANTEKEFYFGAILIFLFSFFGNKHLVEYIAKQVYLMFI
jgi:hypothetical protein